MLNWFGIFYLPSEDPLILSAPLITALSANVTLGATLPMMHTAILGEKSEVQYVVSKGDAKRYAWLSECESGLGVETRVFGHNRLCGFKNNRVR